MSIEGTDDRDEMGICIEPPNDVIGLGSIPVYKNDHFVGWERFEQYQYRTQPEGVRSGPGDLDLVIYSLRKWARLAAQGNPTVLLMLFAPPEEWVETFPDMWGYGRKFQAQRDLFLSKDCGHRFRGYLQAQKEQMLGLRSKHTNRPELIEVYGYDTKFAYHAIRLGLQGVELLTTGHITLPMPEPHRSVLKALRLGGYSKQYALDWIAELQDELDTLTKCVDLPEHADTVKLNRWLIDTYTDWWKGKM